MCLWTQHCYFRVGVIWSWTSSPFHSSLRPPSSSMNLQPPALGRCDHHFSCLKLFCSFLIIQFSLWPSLGFCSQISFVIRLSTSCLQEDPLSLTFLVQATHCSGFYLSPLDTFRTFHSKPHIPAMRPPWKLRLAPHCCSQPVLTTCLTLRDVLERILDFH